MGLIKQHHCRPCMCRDFRSIQCIISWSFLQGNCSWKLFGPSWNDIYAGLIFLVAPEGCRFAVWVWIKWSYSSANRTSLWSSIQSCCTTIERKNMCTHFHEYGADCYFHFSLQFWGLGNVKLWFYNPPPHLTVSDEQAHTLTQSPEGNNRMLENTAFATGADTVHPTGFSPNPSIEFLPPARGRCCSLSSPVSQSKHLRQLFVFANTLTLWIFQRRNGVCVP